MERNLKNSAQPFLRHWWMGKRVEAGRTTWNNETLAISASTKAWIKTSAWVCRCSLPTEVKPFARRAPCDLKLYEGKVAGKVQRLMRSKWRTVGIFARHIFARAFPSASLQVEHSRTMNGLRHNFPPFGYQLTLGGPRKISIQSCCPNCVGRLLY